MLGHMVEVQLKGDPFPVYVDHRQLETSSSNLREDTTMSTTTTNNPSAKELRREAKTLGIAGYLDMDREELSAAIAAASGGDSAASGRASGKPSKSAKATKSATKAERPAKAAKATKSAKATKASRQDAAEGTSDNPFRAGTNLWHVTEALKRGGKRSDLVRKLIPKMEYNPRKKGEAEFDPEVETDRRLKVIGYILKNQHGWDYTHEGRGKDAFIQATPPGDA